MDKIVIELNIDTQLNFNRFNFQRHYPKSQVSGQLFCQGVFNFS
jgi:hypothetical protein